jgi:hypothetical protein
MRRSFKLERSLACVMFLVLDKCFFGCVESRMKSVPSEMWVESVV